MFYYYLVSKQWYVAPGVSVAVVGGGIELVLCQTQLRLNISSSWSCVMDVTIKPQKKKMVHEASSGRHVFFYTFPPLCVWTALANEGAAV